MSQITEGPTKTFENNTAIAPHLRVTMSGGYLAAAGATTVELGTMERRSLSGDEYGTVRLRTAPGTIKMVASGAITKHNPVYAAAGGKIASSGTVYCGLALETSTTDGDIIEVVRGPNTDISSALASTTASTFEVDSDASTPKIALAGQTGGTGDYTGTIKPPATMTEDVDLLMPDADGDTLAVLALAQTLTNKTLGLGTRFTVDSVAATGSDQAGAAELTADAVNIVTAADGTKGVKLPTAVAGSFVIVYDPTATVGLPVYPGSSDDINDGTTDAAVTIEGKTLAIFFAVDDTTWGAIYTANS